MKDRRLVWFTLLLSLLIGGAAAFSLDPAEIDRTIYSFIDTRTGKTFETEIFGRDEKNFESLLTKDSQILSMQKSSRGEGALPHYYLLGTKQLKEIRPYAESFGRGFLFVWMIYFVMAYLIKHLVIREYKQKLSQKRRKTRRKK